MDRETHTNRNQTVDAKPVGQLIEELKIPEGMVSGRSFLTRQFQERKQKAKANREATLKLADDALEQLQQELSSGKSDALVNFLKTVSQFHKYSLRNQLLIMVQAPEASRVAGFNTWKKMGRHVRKGEKGIRILAPVIRRKKEDAKSKNEDDRPLIGFRVTSVFDISQTDGNRSPISRSFKAPQAKDWRL